jgi:predicted Fe-Mo cluster-binding NifX family protein
MKVAISSDNGFVSEHFGRCPGFTLVDVVDGKAGEQEYAVNPGHEPGALPEFLSKKGVTCIVSGGMGVKAQNLFQEKGIETIMGISGDIVDVIKELEAGTLQGGESSCSPGVGKGYGVDKTVCDHGGHE